MDVIKGDDLSLDDVTHWLGKQCGCLLTASSQIKKWEKGFIKLLSC